MIQVINILNNINPTNLTNHLPLMLRDPKTAAKVFGFNTNSLEKSPRHKFLFFVNFLRPNLNNYANWQDGISFLVKSISNPSYEIETEILNQYNKKRVIQKKINYGDIKITFYDTYDSRVLKMFKEYLTFYYGDFQGATPNSWNYDTTYPDFQYVNGNGTEWGYNPPKTDPNNAYFFEKLEIYKFGLGKYSKFSLIHPFIKSFSMDNEDYSDGNSYVSIDIELSYEGILFEVENQLIPSSIIEMAGLDLSEYAQILSNRNGFFNYESRNNSNINNGDYSSSLKGFFRENISQPGTTQNDSSLLNNSLFSSLGNLKPNWFNNSVNTPGINPNNPSPNIAINFDNQFKNSVNNGSFTASTGYKTAENSNIFNNFIRAFI